MKATNTTILKTAGNEKPMNLTGYIDESLNKAGRLFTMSAIIAERMDWMWFEVDWENCIEGINRQLKKDGRTPISGYHASDFSNGKGEFTGWGKEELIDLAKQLLNVLKVDRKSTRLNSSHLGISYAVFCLKK